MQSIHDRSVRQAPPARVYSLEFEQPTGWRFDVFRIRQDGYICEATGPGRLSSITYVTRHEHPTVREALADAREFAAALVGGRP